MKFLLDTDTVSDLYDITGVHFNRLRTKILGLAESDEVYISILTHCELEFSYQNAPDGIKSKIREEINAILRDFTVIPVRGNAAKYYGSLKAKLKQIRGVDRSNIRKHNIDLLLAATAIGESCVLISQDRIYQDLKAGVPEFKTETW